MAKQRRRLPTRKQQDRSRDEKSLLIQSAESLGRMIGALQRQLDGAARKHRAQSHASEPMPAKGASRTSKTRDARFEQKTAAGKSRPRVAAPKSNRAAEGARSRKKSSRKHSR